MIGPGVLLQVGAIPEPLAAQITQVSLLPADNQTVSFKLSVLRARAGASPGNSTYSRV